MAKGSEAFRVVRAKPEPGTTCVDLATHDDRTVVVLAWVEGSGKPPKALVTLTLNDDGTVTIWTERAASSVDVEP